MKKIKNIALIVSSTILVAMASPATAEQYLVKWKDVSNLNRVSNGMSINGVNVSKFEKQSFGGYSVIKTVSPVDQTNALVSSGYFDFVTVDKKFKLPKLDSEATKVSNLENKTSSVVNPKDIHLNSIDLNKYADPLIIKEFYLDEQRPYAMGNTSSIAAEEIVTNNLGRKVRIAVIDTGYQPHEDMEIPKDQYNPMISDYYYDDNGYIYRNMVGCATADPTNSGGDAVCAPENIVTKDIENNNALDKSWKPSSYGVDAHGNAVPTEYKVCVNGHGTAVGGTIASIRGNGVGVSSVLGANNAELVYVKVLDSCTRGGTLSDVIKGIHWSVGDHFDGVTDISSPVDVINLSLAGMSLGGLCDTGFNAMADAVAYANSKGAVVVASTGNDALEATAATPVSCHGIITAAANTLSGELARFSNYYSSRKNISAIGQEVLTPFVDTSVYVSRSGVDSALGDCNKITNCYNYYSGTSLSAPVISSAVALIKMENPSLKAEQIFDVLYNSASEYNTNEVGNKTGLYKLSKNTRLLNMKDAVLAAKAYEMHLGDAKIESFLNGKSDNYVSQMISEFGKNNVCSKYVLTWKDFYKGSNVLTYNVYGQNTTGDVDLSSATLIGTTDVTTTLVDGSYSKFAVVGCAGGNCSAVSQVNLSDAVLPKLCL